MRVDLSDRSDRSDGSDEMRDAGGGRAAALTAAVLTGSRESDKTTDSTSRPLAVSQTRGPNVEIRDKSE